MTDNWKKIKENFKKQHIIVQICLIIGIISIILIILSQSGVKLPISKSILDLIFWISILICGFGILLQQSKVEK